jgi:hypothetical protein
MSVNSWLLVIVYLPAVVGSFLIGRQQPREYVFTFLPLSIVILYIWIGVFDPPIESARIALRYVLLFCGGLLNYVVFDSLLEYRRKSRNG